MMRRHCSWQEIVEAPFRPDGEAALVGWGGQGYWPLDLAEAMAFPALFSAREQDPLSAALDALWSAAVAFGRRRYEALLREARQAFPVLVGP
jgi:hypothetical protein